MTGDEKAGKQVSLNEDMQIEPGRSKINAYVSQNVEQMSPPEQHDQECYNYAHFSKY
jgi:hypothetical protein